MLIHEETPWRKSPTHQGGFLLDGGIHRVAALRLLLGPENTIDCVSAYTGQLQKHLPPADTIDAILKTKTGATGIFSISFGTSFTGNEISIACEGGVVRVNKSTVTTIFDGTEEAVEIQDERTGVPPEIRVWGEAIMKGERNEKQIPEEALADLELVSAWVLEARGIETLTPAQLELMLRSGERNGEPHACSFQI